MLLLLAVRNLSKTWPKRLAFGMFFAATMALLFMGNTAFENSDRGLASTYVQSFTGQASVSTPSPEQFTIFGSDLPLIGEYLVVPTLPEEDVLRRALADRLPRAQVLPQVTSAGLLEVGSYTTGVPVFGVELKKYFAFFPALKLVQGSLPEATQPSAALTSWQVKRISHRIGRPLSVGDTLTLTFAASSSYVTRQVKLAAIFDYPVADDVRDRIALVDPDTARALNGYLYGEEVVLDEATQKLLSSDIDSLFEDEDSVGSSKTGGLSPDDLAKQMRSPALQTRPASVDGAWNFLLVREEGRTDSQVVAEVRQALADHPVLVKDWRETAGGSAQISWFLRLMFNVGLLFIAAVSCLILVNALSLSILERTKEIGTMRALGAQKTAIGTLIGWETLLVVAGMGLLGVAAGAGGAVVLTSANLRIHNVYLESLFGSSVLRLDLSWPVIAEHLLLSVVIGLAAIALPVSKALNIQPVKAIAREQ